MRSLFLATFLTLTGAAAAQSCGTLAITGTGAAGTSLQFAVTGTTSRGFVLLGVAEHTGTTTVDLGSLHLTLGLASPIIPVPMGRASANGDLSVTINVPAGLSQQYALQAQPVTVTLSMMPFSINACVANVVPFTIG
jgi:hypothetical protein